MDEFAQACVFSVRVTLSSNCPHPPSQLVWHGYDFRPKNIIDWERAKQLRHANVLQKNTNEIHHQIERNYKAVDLVLIVIFPYERRKQ